MRMAAEEVKRNVGMDSVLGMYGLVPRHGFIRCPFHGETAGSLKVYTGGRGWHCFGCGRGGSVIDFVMQYEEIGFAEAVRLLVRGFQLEELLREDAPMERGEIENRQRLRRAVDGVRALLLEEISEGEEWNEREIRRMLEQAREIEGKPKQLRTAREWTELTELNDRMQYREDCIRMLDKTREEVMAWRRRGKQVDRQERASAPRKGTASASHRVLPLRP